MIFAPGFRVGYRRPGPPATIAFLSEALCTTSSGTTFSWPGVTLGTGYTSFIAWFGRSPGNSENVNVNSASLAGHPMLIVVQNQGVTDGCAICIISLSSTASGTLSVTFSGNIQLGGGQPYPCRYALWGCTNLLSTTAIDTQVASGATSPWTMNVNSISNGLVVADFGWHAQGTRSLSGTWATADLNVSRGSPSDSMNIGKAAAGPSTFTFADTATSTIVARACAAAFS